MMVQKVFTDSEPHFVSFKFLPLTVHFSGAFELLFPEWIHSGNQNGWGQVCRPCCSGVPVLFCVPTVWG